MRWEIAALSKAYNLAVWTAERVARFPRMHHCYTASRKVRNAGPANGWWTALELTGCSFPVSRFQSFIRLIPS
jgi:hypothetical protein